jgi:phosphohistidine phosphatase SixA
VLVHVLRHACAQDKLSWEGADRDRPLDDTGDLQVEVLTRHFAPSPPRRILSSPALRCVRTVEPLARQIGVPVEAVDEVDRDGHIADLQALAWDLARDDGGLICTHGELMALLLDQLRQTGTAITSLRSAADDWLLRKATAWILTHGSDGTVTALHHLVPDGLPACPDPPDRPRTDA